MMHPGGRRRTCKLPDDYERCVAIYGVRRTDQEFWAQADWFQERYAEDQPLQAGLFELNRYRNR